MADDDLADFDRTTFAPEGGKERAVYRKGTGPAVIVIAEMPGITPQVADFARRIADLGCTAVMPDLFGTAGRDPFARGKLSATVYSMSSILPACVSREFATWATGRTSPVVEWLRDLARHEHQQCGGPGVGAVGMCFTGGFALAMAADPVLVAPVLSQPSLPLAIRRRQKESIDCSPDDLAVVKQRCAAEGLEVVGLRFRGDRFVPPERFDLLRRELGEAFVAVELDPETANPEARIKQPHSVLTEHLNDEPGEPTREALDLVLEHLKSRLLPH